MKLHLLLLCAGISFLTWASPAADLDPVFDKPEARPETRPATKAEAKADAKAPKPVPKIVRGPYLQMGTTNSVIVRWRTDLPTISRIHFGTNFANQKLRAKSEGTLTEHVVVVTNLQPDVKYYYSVYTYTLGGTNETLAGGKDFFFHANPLVGTNKPVRAWVLGDSGTARPTQFRVRDAYYKFTGARPTDLWLMLGDNAYAAGKDEEYDKGLFKVYPEMLRKSVLWPCLGNHDGAHASSATQTGFYYDWVSLPTLGQAGGLMSGTEAYFSFDYANIHFISLDSHDSDRTTNGLMYRWLKADLAASTLDWTIAYWHHPPYTKGSHDSDNEKDSGARSQQMRASFLPLLEAAGVDLVLCGHSHAYERSWLMDGHYERSTNFSMAMVLNRGDGRTDGDGPYYKPTRGPAAHEGVVYIVAGSSGQMSGVKALHPVMYQALNSAGSLVLDVNGPRLDSTFLDERGLVRDYFTILKGAKETLPVPVRPAVKVPLVEAPTIPEHLRFLADQSAADLPLSSVTNARPSDAAALWQLHAQATAPAHQARVRWALAWIADGQVATNLLNFVTARVKDRPLTVEEEEARLQMYPLLGFLSIRYETPFDLLKQGVHPTLWQANKYWTSPRPHESPARFAMHSVEALGLSGRPEAIDVFTNLLKKGVEFRTGTRTNLVKVFDREIATARRQIELFQQLGPQSYPHKALQMVPATVK